MSLETMLSDLKATVEAEICELKAQSAPDVNFLLPNNTVAGKLQKLEKLNEHLNQEWQSFILDQVLTKRWSGRCEKNSIWNWAKTKFLNGENGLELGPEDQALQGLVHDDFDNVDL